jgi:charged multivesicular body protein 6
MHAYTDTQAQEISELLANKMSNQDEDEVEDELEALEAEVNGANGVITEFPIVPVAKPEFTPQEKAQMAKDRAARRARERAAEQASQPMLA